MSLSFHYLIVLSLSDNVRANARTNLPSHAPRFHRTQLDSLNSQIRSYNALAPYAVRWPYLALQAELDACYEGAAEEIKTELVARRNVSPGVKVDVSMGGDGKWWNLSGGGGGVSMWSWSWGSPSTTSMSSIPETTHVGTSSSPLAIDSHGVHSLYSHSVSNPTSSSASVSRSPSSREGQSKTWLNPLFLSGTAVGLGLVEIVITS